MHDDERQATVQQAITVPLIQSLVTGVLVGIVAGIAAVLLTWQHPLAIGAGVFALTTLTSWLSYRQAWQRRIDALVGLVDELRTQNTEAQTVRLEVISEGGRTGDFLYLPTDRARLIQFAQGVTAGVPLTTRAWTGKRGLYSPGEFAALTAELINRGYAEYRSPHDHRAGVDLTRQGRPVIRYLSKLQTDTHPTDTLPQFITTKAQDPGTHTHDYRGKQ